MIKYATRRTPYLPYSNLFKDAWFKLYNEILGKKG